jgi:Flp pilus assembly protein TadD
VETKTKVAERAYRAGKLARLRGRHAAAERLLRRAAELVPEDCRPRYELAKSLVDQGRFDEALALLDAVERLEPDRPPHSLRGVALCLRAGRCGATGSGRRR